MPKNYKHKVISNHRRSIQENGNPRNSRLKTMSIKDQKINPRN
jgi:hypothetical protein